MQVKGQPIFSPAQICEATGGTVVCGDASGELRGVSIDSRTLEHGNLFVAIRGARFDGHDFVQQALEQGATGAIVDQWPLRIVNCEWRIANGKSQMANRPTVWRVPDTLAAWGALAQYHRRRFNPKLVAVTGSTGKTTVKTMLWHLISGFEEVLVTSGTQNNLIGVPLTLFHLRPEHKSAVLELGTNRWGEIRRLTVLAEPTIGMVTNIGPAHLESFKDLRGVLREKAGLWEAMSPKGVVILNAEDPLLWEAGQHLSQRVVWFGQNPKSPIQISHVHLKSWGTHCWVNQREELTIPIPGRHNLMNAWAALTAIEVLGFKLTEAISRLESVPAIVGRLFPREFQGALLVDDSYNANPASFKAALEVIRRVESKARRIVVLGDMLELGDQAQTLHAQAGRQVGRGKIDFLVSVGKWSQTVLEAACEAGLSPENGRAFDGVEEAGRFLMEMVRPGDAVLLKGSRGMQMEKILEPLSQSRRGS